MKLCVSALACAAAMTLGASAAAQVPPPPDPTENAPVHIGPLAARPSLIFRDVGVDTNVFDSASDPKQDFTATMGARVDASMKGSRFQGTFASSLAYLYFQRYTTERGVNRAAEARVDVLLGHLRPYVTGAVSANRDRPNSEIDARVTHRQPTYGAGVAVGVLSHTSLTASYQHASTRYDANATFLGRTLARQLNQTSERVTGGVDLQLTPLTALGLTIERVQDRFEVAGERDADTRRYAATLRLDPLALISGRATIAYRQFKPNGRLLRPLNGPAASIAIGFTARDQTKVSLAFDRDIRYSVEEATPYYLSTGFRALLTQRISGPIDAQVLGGFERLRYEPLTDLPDTNRSDRVRTIGAGLGTRIGTTARLGLNVEDTRRRSPVDRRQYDRRRILASLTYGF